MFKTFDAQCGDIFLTHISGVTGLGVELGQKIVGSGNYFTHAGIVGPGQRIIQAQPGGAVELPLMTILGEKRLAYSAFDLTPKQRSDIWSAAQHYLGTPYSFADYAAIPAYRLLHTDALEIFVGETGHMICSQLVTQCYLDAGIKLFPDRVPGDVAPGDIANLIGAK
jgi:uncharacterized protein YycO